MRLSFYLKDNNGFSLIEVVIALSILGSLILAISKFILVTSSMLNTIKIENKVNNDVNRLFDFIEMELKKSDEIFLVKDINGNGIYNNKYPDNIGYLIRQKEANNMYLFITFCNDNGNIRRLSYRTSRETIPNLRFLGGYNTIVKGNYSIKKSYYEKSESYIKNKIEINDKSFEKYYYLYQNQVYL